MKQILNRIANLIRSPQKEWEAIVAENFDMPTIRDGFFFPCLYFVLGVVFMAGLFRYDFNADFRTADFLSYMGVRLLMAFSMVFAGVYISTIALGFLLSTKRFGGAKRDLLLCFKMVVYSSSILWALMLFHLLVPSLFFLPVLSIYVLYVVWCGLPILYPSMEETRRPIVSLIIWFFLSGCPMFFEKAMTALINS